MKVRELINHLEGLEAEHGDLFVEVWGADGKQSLINADDVGHQLAGKSDLIVFQVACGWTGGSA